MSNLRLAFYRGILSFYGHFSSKTATAAKMGPKPSSSRSSSTYFSGSSNQYFSHQFGHQNASINPTDRLIMFAMSAAGVSGVAGGLYLFMSKDAATKEGPTQHLPFSGAHSASITGLEVEKRKLTAREKRFMKFASVEFNGQLYMTPLDFLESVVESEPRPRYKRRKLTEKDLDEYGREVPRLSRNDEKFFRNMGNQGIISFSEYLFLLTILIKPQSGFKIAFAMLDQDGSQSVDKEEFKVLESVFSTAAKERKENATMEKAAADGQKGETVSKSATKITDDEFGLQKAHNVDTTLSVYFFGKRGLQVLKFDDFRKFMDNLQTEVLSMEYGEFSKGAKTITEVDFARILLRYTFLNGEEYENILTRLEDRLQGQEKGITFEEFKDFCQFLNNLDDFEIAMSMYTLADMAISEEEFVRAVRVCTGQDLGRHLVHVVFQIFDEDGDGMLSYREFIAIMKDRVNRGLKSFSRLEGWAGFKKCVKQEVKNSSSGSGGASGGGGGAA